MIGRVLRALGRDRSPVVVIECRRCGTSVDSEAEPCAACGSEHTVRYEIR